MGCCRAEATREITLSNTLQGNIFYRDVYRAVTREGMVLPRAHVGVEVRALAENPARRYWVQHALRSGHALDGQPYRHEDWTNHQPILLDVGELNGTGATNRAAPVSRAGDAPHAVGRPNRDARKMDGAVLARRVRDRHVAGCKNSPDRAGPPLGLGTDPARAFVYDGDSLAPLFAGADHDATDATDAAILGDKLFVVRPGELFAYDTDAGQVALVYTVSGETRAARFVERVGARVLALYVDETQMPATRCYDLTFGAPRLAWELAAPVTFCAPDGDGLAVGSDSELWTSADGVAAATLAHTFSAAITAMSGAFVGLAKGQVWQRGESGVELVLNRAAKGPVGGVATRSAGTQGEVAGQLPARRGWRRRRLVVGRKGERLLV